jgi:hypothetical protein
MGFLFCPINICPETFRNIYVGLLNMLLPSWCFFLTPSELCLKMDFQSRWGSTDRGDSTEEKGRTVELRKPTTC